MRTLRLLLFFTFILCLNQSYAQKNYWQQKVDNDISVRLDDIKHLLHGSLHIHYQNNSPDTLTFIYFHLYPNAYKSDQSAYAIQALENRQTTFFYADKKSKGYIDSLDFKVETNGKYISAEIQKTKEIDIIKVILPEKLFPGKSINLSTDFRVKIPIVFSRLGHDGQDYQISQWFPKPAVYDAKGWHPIPYLDQGEFYSEFGDYKVSITLPANYIVMGTGDIQEASENKWLEDLAKIQHDSASLAAMKKVPVSDTIFKTITFREQQIHDFAWFASKKWVIRMDTVLAPGTDHVVTAYSCFLPSDWEIWKNSVDDIKTTIRGYGTLVGPYPYNTAKVVEGSLKAGGGMEYPTVTVIDAVGDVETLHSVIIHEVGHNWFYGKLGSNERSYPWMDEGINSYYETKIYPPPPSYKKAGGASDNSIGLSVFGAAHSLYPATTASQDLPYMNYGVDIYYKVPQYLVYLEKYMGTENFDSAMRKYFSTWKFKHPQPEDFEKIFREKSPKDISWFFELMARPEGVDFAINKVEVLNDSLMVKIENKTGIILPVLVNVISSAGDTMSQWSAPFLKEQNISFKNVTSYKSVFISNDIPDINLKNNFNKKYYGVNAFGGINYSKQKTIWISPFAGLNRYDGIMVGAILHNVSVPENPFKFIIAPMFGTRSKNLVGHATFNYTKHLTNSIIENIDFFLYLKSYGFSRSYIPGFEKTSLNYQKVAPEVVFNFRRPSYRSSVSHSISLKGYYITEQDFKYDSLFTVPEVGNRENNIYGKLSYNIRDSRLINPYNVRFEGQLGKTFAKISATANYKFNYSLKGKAFYARAYAGKFFKLSDQYFDYYRYQLANTYSGSNDYFYDETFIGRNENSGLWSRQISINEGGFKSPLLQNSNQAGFNDDFLLSLNLKTDLPLGKIPIRLFFDISTFGGDNFIFKEKKKILYEAGIELTIKDFFTVHIPLVMSDEFKEYKETVLGGKFLKTITFSHNLNKINWVKAPNMLLRIE